MSKKTRSTSARRLRRRKRSKILRLLGLPATYRPPKPSTNGNGKHSKNGKYSNGRNGKHGKKQHKNGKPNRDPKPQFKPQANPPLPVSSVVAKPKSSPSSPATSDQSKSQPPLSLFDSAKSSTEPSQSVQAEQKPDLVPVRSHSRSNKVANYKRQKPTSLLQDERKLVSDLGLVGQAISRRWRTPEHVLERLVPLVWRLARQSEDEKVRLSAADVLRKLVESDRKADVDQITLLLKKRELENAERVDDANRPKAVEIVVENRDQANRMMGWDEFQDRRISIDSVTEDGESDTPEAESRRLETILEMLDEDGECDGN